MDQKIVDGNPAAVEDASTDAESSAVEIVQAEIESGITEQFSLEIPTSIETDVVEGLPVGVVDETKVDGREEVEEDKQILVLNFCESQATQTQIDHDQRSSSSSGNDADDDDVNDSQDMPDFLDTDMEEQDPSDSESFFNSHSENLLLAGGGRRSNNSNSNETNQIGGLPSHSGHNNASSTPMDGEKQLEEPEAASRGIAVGLGNIILIEDRRPSDDEVEEEGEMLSDTDDEGLGMGEADVQETSGVNARRHRCVLNCEACNLNVVDAAAAATSSTENGCVNRATASTDHDSSSRRSSLTTSTTNWGLELDDGDCERLCSCWLCQQRHGNLFFVTCPCRYCRVYSQRFRTCRASDVANLKAHLQSLGASGSFYHPIHLNIAGPLGLQLLKDVHLSQHKLQNPTENSALQRELDGEDFHSMLLKNSFPTNDFKIWSYQEAQTHQALTPHLGPSSCGAAAVLHILRIFGIEIATDVVEAATPVRLRASENASLGEYLLSRANAGTTHQDLIGVIESLTDGQIKGRFFACYPARKFHLLAWLIFWIKNGAVPLLTLNMQRGLVPGHPLPDAWHHQVAFGGGAAGLYLTNPLECMQECVLSELLCSPSILLVRVSDVRAHLAHLGLNQILSQIDNRWRSMNVIGQIMSVVRECSSDSGCCGGAPLTHIVIPAAYKSGVTLFARTESLAWNLLHSAPELQLAADEG